MNSDESGKQRRFYVGLRVVYAKPNGAVPALVKLLPLRHEPTQEAAARALKNIAFDTTAAAQVAQAGGMQPLVRLLQSGSPSLHQAATAALEVLTLDPVRRASLEECPPHCPPQSARSCT